MLDTRSVAPDLSRRERQILDVLYRVGCATAAEVRQAIPQAPSYSAVRALLRILEDKGHVRHEEDGKRYIYRPAVERHRAKRSALRHMLNTFFEGSTTQAVLTLLHEDSKQLTSEDWDRLTEMIESARKRGV